MKLTNVNNAVESSGVSDTSTFSIAMNAKAFRVLSDSLYQNKIGSIVREISCNALDGHTAAGRADVPFEIHLPDAYEPHFHVKDFGVGLSPDQVINIFTKYFESTKDESNNLVGAFGLGGKSPFSYTDQFTIESVYDGVVSIYSAYISDSGIPAVSVLNRSETTARNGVTITIAVKRGDESKFVQETASQLRFFTVKPVIKNAPNFKFDEVNTANPLIKSKLATITGTPAQYGRTSNFIIQGNVGYPLDIAQLEGKIRKENLDFFRHFQSYYAYFYFNIGEIGVTASREGVEYNKHTVSNIEKKVIALRAEVQAFIDTSLANAKTAWDKAVFLNSNNVLFSLAKASNIQIPGLVNSSSRFYFDLAPLVKMDLVIKSYSRGMERADSNPEYNWIPTKNNGTVIILNDAKSGNVKRVRNYMAQNSNINKVILINGKDGAELPSDLEATLLKKYDGIPAIKYLSDTPLTLNGNDDSDNEKETYSYNRPSYYVWNETKVAYSCYDWVRKTDKLSSVTSNMLYFFTNRNKVDDYVDNLNVLFKSGLLDGYTVVGVPMSFKARIENKDNWVYAPTFIKEKLDEIKKSKKYRAYKIADQIKSCMIQSELKDFVVVDNKVVESLPASANHPLSRLRALYKKAEITIAKNADAKFALVAGSEASNTLSRRKIEKILVNLDNRYPFLRVTNYWALKPHLKPDHVVQYLLKM